MTKTKTDYLIGFIGDREGKTTQAPVIRVPKDECPDCDSNENVVRNGYDYLFKGTRREKQIPKYICNECGLRFRERNYISAAHLMTRQAAILWLEGFDYKQISKRLGLDEVTAKRYVLSLLRYKKAILVRKTAEEESPRAKSYTKLVIPLVKMWKEPKNKDE